MKTAQIDLAEDANFDVVLMRPCAVTHSNDMNQRSILLSATRIGITDSISVAAIDDSTLAPPGPYMVFLLDKTDTDFPDGVPSEARWIFLKQGTPAGNNKREWTGTINMAADSSVAYGDTLVVKSGALVRMGTNPGDAHNIGIDSGKIEIIVDGVMQVESGVAFRASLNSNANDSLWYGIRVRPTGKVSFQGSPSCELKNARSAIAWEQPKLPNFADYDNVAFSKNRVRMSFDRDVVVPLGTDAAIPAGWSLGFEPTDHGGSGKDPTQVELIALGKLDINGSSGSPDTLRSSLASGGKWYGLRFVDANDNDISTLTYADFRNARYCVSTDSLSGNIQHCKFSSDSTDIFIDRDTRIPSGTSWILDDSGGTIVWTNESDPGISTHTGVDPLRVELLVEGSLDLQGGAVTFRSRHPTHPNADWYGIRTSDFTNKILVNNEVIKHARAPFILENFGPTEVASLLNASTGLKTKVTIDSCTTQLSLARDVTVSSSSNLPIPAGWTLGFAANRDVAEAGVDPARTEVRVTTGTLTFDPNATSGTKIVLRSDNPSAAAGEWFGIRTTDTDVDGAIAFPTASGAVEIMHARGAFAIEGVLGTTWPNFSTLGSKVVFTNNVSRVSLDRDQEITDSRTLPAGWTFGFAANRDEGSSGNGTGIDTDRVELLVKSNGTLTFDPNATSSSKVVLRSDDPDPSPGDWYGIRTGDTSLNTRIVLPSASGAVEVGHARGAFALEGTGWPTFSTVGSEVVFTNNVSMISFDRDQVVGNSTSRTIPAGWTIGFSALRDSVPAASSVSSKCELIVEGTGVLRAVGTASQPIKLVSDMPGGGDEDWYGMRYALSGAQDATYGYVACSGACPRDTMKLVQVSGARFGVVVESLRAPILDSLSFNDIDSSEIYLRNTDVVLTVDPSPSGLKDYWTLLPGTRVRATKTCATDLSYGNANRVDLVIFGGLSAYGAPGDSVTFGVWSPTAEGDPNAGDDWGGLSFRNAKASVIKYAQIGHAKNPVFAYLPGAQVGFDRSTIHHFKETGAWIYGSAGQSVSFNNSRVVRGDGLNAVLGDQGILLDQCDRASVLNTVVSLRGLDNNEGGVGIELVFGSSLCQTSPSTERDVLLQDNVVLGPGLNATGALYSGIRLETVCGSSNRDIDILENDLEEWKFAGLEINQSSDVQVSCNLIEMNNRGVEVIRTSTTTSPVRFRENKIRALNLDPSFHAVATNESTAVGLGTDSATRGDNRLVAHVSQTKLLRNTDSNQVDATDNFWFTNATDGGETTSDVLLTPQTVQGIVDRLVGSVAYTGYDQNDGGWPCSTSVRDTTSSATSTPPPSHLASVADAAPTGAVDPGLPTIRFLGKPYPNPSRGVVDLKLAIPPSDVGRYMLEVFDVTGRRVFGREWDIAAPGYYRVGWGGRDRDGLVVGAGVFFLRVRGPSFHELRKVVVLH